MIGILDIVPIEPGKRHSARFVALIINKKKEFTIHFNINCFCGGKFAQAI
jgi:hypothetical protein